jgi:hypothetical protein
MHACTASLATSVPVEGLGEQGSVEWLQGVVTVAPEADREVQSGVQIPHPSLLLGVLLDEDHVVVPHDAATCRLVACLLPPQRNLAGRGAGTKQPAVGQL